MRFKLCTMVVKSKKKKKKLTWRMPLHLGSGFSLQLRSIVQIWGSGQGSCEAGPFFFFFFFFFPLGISSNFLYSDFGFFLRRFLNGIECLRWFYSLTYSSKEPRSQRLPLGDHFFARPGCTRENRRWPSGAAWEKNAILHTDNNRRPAAGR